ncbi:MAG: alpha/beta hydrolase fold domain-containing protein [Bacteroidaceae bacterium]|nr:alpha/beta hydrolase fold domain-containing protein [Bacteroidaceae bacterium]
MKPLRLFLAALAILGAGVHPVHADPQDNINLLFIGNSITAGATLSNASTQAPPILCRKLIANATEVTTNVYNGGHSGITTWGFLPGRDDFTRLLAAAKAYQKNNGGLVYISIMLGTNDSACTTTEGAPVSTDTYRANMKKIIDALIEGVPGCKILLNYPIWYSPSTYNGAMYLQEGLDRLHSYYPILDGIVEEYDQVYAGNRGVWEYFENNKALFTRESGNAGYFYLHPNLTGANRLAEIWANSLLELIKADGIEVKNPLPEWNTFKPSNTKKYSMKTSRGDMGTKDGKLTSTVKTGIDATKGEFAFLSHGNQLFLYSIADKAFMYRDPQPYRDDWSNLICSNELLQSIKVNYTGTPTAYPYYLTMDEYVFNSAASTQTGICANTYTPHDAGNQTAITEEGDFDPTEALAILNDYFEKQVTVTYRIQDGNGKELEVLTAVGQEGQVISEVPGHVTRKAYTTYEVIEPITLARGADNVVRVLASWKLPFETFTDIADAHWYNLALREGANYVNAAEGYKCNPVPTQEDVNSDAYQWAFQGNPYDGIVVYNRSDVTKTLAKVYSEEKQNDVAELADGVFRWRIVESEKGFLLATDGSYPYINEYGGSGGHLGFWGSITDVGSIFIVSEVGSLTVENVRLSTGATIQLFKSDVEKANGRAILVIPGGGYAYVAGSSEGSDWAPMLNELGYTVAVLNYTTPPTAPEGPLTQAREAMQYLRDNADTCHVQTGLVGVMGFSAGGHLASTVATHTTGDERPAFQILFYPVISMDASITHAGSRENLLGKNPSKELIELYSNDKQVTPETPMAYLCWASNDGTVPTANSNRYIAALKKNNVPYHKKVFSTGGHGFGFKTTFEYHDVMVKDLTEWLLSIDDIFTGIRQVRQSGSEGTVNGKRDNDRCYNLAGQTVTNPYRGIHITRGHKLLR